MPNNMKVHNPKAYVGNPVPAAHLLTRARASWGKFMRDRFGRDNAVYGLIPKNPCVDEFGSPSLKYTWKSSDDEMMAGTSPWNSIIDEQWISSNVHDTNMYRFSNAITIDEDLIDMGIAVPELDIKQQLIAASDAIRNLMNDMIIRGDPLKKNPHDPVENIGAFKGLLTYAREKNQVITDNPIDLTAPLYSKDDRTNKESMKIAQNIGAVISMMDPKPTFLIANNTTINALSAVAMSLGQYQLVHSGWDVGKLLPSFCGIAMIPAGSRAMNRREEIIPSVEQKTSNSAEAQAATKGDVVLDYKSQIILGSFGDDSIFGLTKQKDDIYIRERALDSNNKKFILNYWFGMACVGPNCLRVADVLVPRDLVIRTQIP